MVIFYRIFLFVLISLMMGCSFVSTEHKTSLQKPYKKISGRLAEKIIDSRVVLVGETHNNTAHHTNQLKLIKYAHKAWGKDIQIGLEMIQQPFQQYLDAYIANNITEPQMLDGTEWDTRWRYDFALYRPIFEFAKTNNIPLVALNIPREITQKISKLGIQGLNKTERQLLPPVIDTSRKSYRNRLQKVFRLHSHSKYFKLKAFESFLAAQLAWDEGMAFAASNYLKHRPEKRMVILAGSGHLSYRDGIPSRIDRLLSTRSLVVLNMTEEEIVANKADFYLHYEKGASNSN